MAFCSIRRMRVRDKLSPFARRETQEEFGQKKEQKSLVHSFDLSLILVKTKLMSFPAIRV